MFFSASEKEYLGGSLCRLDRLEAERVKVEGPKLSETADTYPMPKDGWVCFHCGERFRTPGSARDHFGPTMESTVACRIKAGDERGLVMALRKAEENVQFWRNRAFAAEGQVEMLEGSVASLTTELKSYKPFRNCETLRDIFNVYDSMEGRALAAEERAERVKVSYTKEERECNV